MIVGITTTELQLIKIDNRNGSGELHRKLGLVWVAFIYTRSWHDTEAVALILTVLTNANER